PRRTLGVSRDHRGGIHGVAARAAAAAALRDRATPGSGGGIVVARMGLSKAILVCPWDSRGRSSAATLASGRHRARGDRRLASTEGGGATGRGRRRPVEVAQGRK